MNKEQSEKLVRVLKSQNEIMKQLRNTLNIGNPPVNTMYNELFDTLDEDLKVFQKSLEL